MKILKVTKKYNEKKLSSFLFDQFNGLTNNTFNKALRKKDIRINDIKVSENVTIYEGDEVKVYIVDELLEKKEIIDSLEIVYEDSNIVVFNKPANIEVTGKNSMETFLQKQYDGMFIKPCHRIDRNTMGLVMFAKNEESLDILFKMFKNKKIVKHYKCIVVGIPKPNEKIVKSYLFKDNKQSRVYISDVPKKGYREVITEYKVIRKYAKENLSLLDIKLHTGRTHQIRAHLAHIGYPILGDGKYGINKINKMYKTNYQQLCSYSLEFDFGDEENKLSYLNKKKIVLKDYEKDLIKI